MAASRQRILFKGTVTSYTRGVSLQQQGAGHTSRDYRSDRGSWHVWKLESDTIRNCTAEVKMNPGDEQHATIGVFVDSERGLRVGCRVTIGIAKGTAGLIQTTDATMLSFANVQQTIEDGRYTYRVSRHNVRHNKGQEGTRLSLSGVPRGVKANLVSGEMLQVRIEMA